MPGDTCLRRHSPGRQVNRPLRQRSRRQEPGLALAFLDATERLVQFDNVPVRVNPRPLVPGHATEAAGADRLRMASTLPRRWKLRSREPGWASWRRTVLAGCLAKRPGLSRSRRYSRLFRELMPASKSWDASLSQVAASLTDFASPGRFLLLKAFSASARSWMACSHSLPASLSLSAPC